REVWVIEHVKQLHAKLQTHILSEVLRLGQRDIHILNARAARGVTAKSAERSGSRHCKSRRIDPVIRPLVHWSPVRAGHSIWPVRGALRTANVCGQRHVKRAPRLGNADNANAPPTEQRLRESLQVASPASSCSKGSVPHGTECPPMTRVEIRVCALGPCV